MAQAWPRSAPKPRTDCTSGRTTLPRDHDPLTGEVLPDGEEGELVFTSLTKEAMPVIRYPHPRLTKLLPGTARSMRRMEKVTGRTDDMIILARQSVSDPDRRAHLVDSRTGAPVPVCPRSTGPDVDRLTVRVETRRARPRTTPLVLGCADAGDQEQDRCHPSPWTLSNPVDSRAIHRQGAACDRQSPVIFPFYPGQRNRLRVRRLSIWRTTQLPGSGLDAVEHPATRLVVRPSSVRRTVAMFLRGSAAK